MVPLSHTTVQLASTSTATFAGFMVEARESNSPFRQHFEEGSTIWGTWIADQNNRYHAVECNRNMSSSEGPFQVRYYIPTHTYTIPYSGKFRERKLSRILHYSRKFSQRNLGAWHLWRGKSERSAKVFSLESFPLYGTCISTNRLNKATQSCFPAKFLVLQAT